MIPVRIKGTGLYAPGEPIDNDELKKLASIEFDSEKIEEKLGIKKRHIAHLRGIMESAADFATNAALDAIKNSKINPNEIGLFVVGSDTPEYISPATAVLVQGRIQQGESWTSSYDINASCASFSIALHSAATAMASDNSIRYAMVIGVYNMPAFLRPGDSFGYPIFADGAGAVVLERTADNSSGYIAGLQLTDGTQWDYIGIYAGGAKNPGY